MKFFKKSTICQAMTVAMVAGGLLASNQAFSYSNLDADTAVTNAAAVAGDADGLNPYVNKNGMGQALIYPYYTVKGGFKTTFNVFNTSDTHVVAVKVRLREHQNSRDVLDFNLLLSPNDKWSANILVDGDGAKLQTTDTSCTAPAIPTAGQPLSPVGYMGNDDYDFDDVGDQTFERLQQGYIEIVPMAWAPATGTGAPVSAVNAVHVDATSEPKNCEAVELAFEHSGSVWTASTSNTATPGAGTATILSENGWVAMDAGENPLFGELALINATNGVAGGTNAIAIADWMSDSSLLTTQEFPYYLEPTLATSAGIWDTANFGLTNTALMASSITNEWADNPTNGANVDWVVSFPTKSFHVDVDDDNIQAGNNQWRFDRTNVAAARPTLAPFSALFTADGSTVDLDMGELYDSEERMVSTDNSTGGSIGFSPGSLSSESAAIPQIRYEANVISFADEDHVLPVDETSHPLRYPAIEALEGGKTNGHVTMKFREKAAGLPVVGFAFKERNLGVSGEAYGQVFDHKYNAD